MKRTKNMVIGTDSRSVVNAPVFQWWDYPIFIALSVLSLGAMVSFFLQWFSFNDWQRYPVAFGYATLILIVILINNQGRWFLLFFMKKPRPMISRPGWKVAVITTFVPSGEPLEMLEETVQALVGLDYPHDTWVLDEGDDERVKALCFRLGAKHFSRKNFLQRQAREGAFQSDSKHGNYNAWFHEIGSDHYDIVAAFDPDHIPYANFLSSVVGYFEDPEVAYVQAPQAYYNQKASFIARGAAEETYAYYSSIQMASYGLGYPIIIGSHNTHRVTALKQIGGFAAHDADDLLTTLRYRASGWKGIYVPEILARGLTPVDWRGYLRQQRRWARSVLDVKLRQSFKYAKALPLKSRIMSLLQGLNYLHRPLIFFFGLLLISRTLATGRTPAAVSYVTIQKFGILCAVLQICEFYRQRFYLDRRNEWGFHWRVVLLQYAKWPWFLGALLDVLLNKQKPYELTEKVNSSPARRALLWPHLIAVVLLALSWFAGWMLEVAVHPSVWFLAALLLVTSGALIWTDFWRIPAPFDRQILRGALSNEPATGAHKKPKWLLPDGQIRGDGAAQAPATQKAAYVSHGGQAPLEASDPSPVSMTHDRKSIPKE